MRRALATAALVMGLADPAVGHDVEQAEALLGEIATYRRNTVEGATDTVRAESAFKLGATVETLVEAVNRDVAAHGRDLYAELLVQRLRAHALNVSWGAEQGRYTYDLAAFRDYLRQAPRGRWAAEAKFRLLARRFYATLGTDPGIVVGTDIAGLLEAVAEEQRFLGEHASHERAATVRFFLAVDHYRIARNVADPVRSQEHARRARQALQQTVERSSDLFEVRAAQALLETLGP